MNESDFKKLLVWQQADEFAFQVYNVSKSFPGKEVFGVTSQLRRSVLSVPTNISEACGRQGKGETRQFVNIALGSLSEVEYLLHFCHRLDYLDDEVFKDLMGLRRSVGALLCDFTKVYDVA